MESKKSDIDIYHRKSYDKVELADFYHIESVKGTPHGWNFNELLKFKRIFTALETCNVGSFMDKHIEAYTTKITYAKVLEVGEKAITAKVLLSEEQRQFKVRLFEIEPLKDLNLSVNDFIQITVLTMPGERRFTYKIINNPKIESVFEKKEYFKGLENTELFQPLPSGNENNI